MSYFDDVGNFHRKFGLPHYGDGTAPGLPDPDVALFRGKFLQEELDEFKDAVSAGNLLDAADALADLVYVALGTAHMMELPFEEIWTEVQRANMTKVRASGSADPLSKRSHRMDVVKPPGFIPPDHGPAIAAARLRACNLEDILREPADDAHVHPNGSVTRASSHQRPAGWWDRWILGLAGYVATASKDETQIGAVVVAQDDRRKMAYGYNGFGPGIADTPERLADRKTKYALVNHAEENALTNATFDVRGGTLYCTRHPCVRCARAIISRRVARVVTGPLPEIEPGRWTEEIPMAGAMLAEAKIPVEVLLDG